MNKLTSRERLMRIFRGEEIDRPALKLWGAGPDVGWQLHEAYRPVSELAAQTTDLFAGAGGYWLNPMFGTDNRTKVDTWKTETGDPLWLDHHTRIHTPKGEIEMVHRVSQISEPGYDMEHYVKDEDDIEKLLSIPYDTLSGMISSVSEDLDGDGNRTEKDRWGMLFQRDTLTSFLNGFGIRVMTKNGEDIPELTLMTDEGVVVLDRIFDLLYQPENCLNVMKYFGDATWSDDMVTTFEANNALLMWIRMADVENLRTMDVDFGILPIPKYTAEQNDYICAVNPYVGTVTCILQTNYDPHMTGYFIEAMAAESRYTLLPAYYDVNLKGKISRDVESQDMLDIIFTHRAYDLGQTYDPGNFSNTLIYMTMNEDRDFASKWASGQKMINKSLEKILKNFQ